MSIPNPAALAKRLTEQKKLEMQKAELSQSLSMEQRVFNPSRSSVKGKGRDTSSKSERTTSEPSNSSTAQPTSSKKPFERKPHLTQRLSQNEELRNLRASLPSSSSSTKSKRS